MTSDEPNDISSLLAVLSHTVLLRKIAKNLDLASLCALGQLCVAARHLLCDEFWRNYYRATGKPLWDRLYAPMFPKVQHRDRYRLKLAICKRGISCPMCFLNRRGTHTRPELAEMTSLDAEQLPPNEYLLWLALHASNRVELSMYAEWRCLVASCYWDEA